jgi:hypothetical protein
MSLLTPKSVNNALNTKVQHWVTPSQPSSGGLDAMRMGKRIGWWEELIDAIK